MKAIWSRVNAKKHEWRKILKGVSLAEYLMKNGNTSIIDFIRDDSYDIRMLTTYMCFIDGIDRGE